MIKRLKLKSIGNRYFLYRFFILTLGVINNTNLYGTGKYQITASYTSANLENITLTSFGKTSGVFAGTIVNAYFHIILQIVTAVVHILFLMH